jgi:ABC-type glycerol-3-phosphate transport system permease component
MRRALVWSLIGLFCVVALAPFLYVISTSLKQTRVLFDYPPDWIPNDPYVGNYSRLLSDYPFLRWVGNTLFVAGVVTAVKLLIDSMAAYALTRMHFAGRRLLLGAMVATIMIPPALLIIPLFFLVRDAGLLDTYWALILPPLANPIGIFMMRGFIDALPADLEHAARIDGAGPFRTYWHVILPLVKPGLVVVGVYVFLIQYTNFVWPLVATSSEDLYVLTTGLARLKPNFTAPDWGLISAGSVAAMVPITVVFLLLQRQFVAASLAGALKG